MTSFCRPTVKESFEGTYEAAKNWECLFKSAQTELKQQQKMIDSLVNCLQKADAERKIAEEAAQSNHEKAVEWQKKFESAHCKACSAASMAAEKENELQAFDEKVVEMLLGIKEDRIKYAKMLAEADIRTRAALKRLAGAEQRERAASQRARELEQRELAASQRARELEQREQQALQRAEEAEAGEDQLEADSAQLSKAWESAKALLLAAQQAQQEQEAQHSMSSAPAAPTAQGPSSSAAAGAQAQSAAASEPVSRDRATLLLKHQLTEKDYAIKKLQLELRDMRRVAAQVAADRQAATPLPPITPRKRSRSDETEARGEALPALNAADGGVQPTQSAQDMASASSGHGPLVQQDSGVPTSAAPSQALSGTPQGTPLQDPARSADPPRSPRGAAAQRPSESTCPAVVNIMPRQSVDEAMAGPSQALAAMNNDQSSEWASSTQGERPSVTSSAEEQDSQSGDPKTQQCTEMMRVLAEKIRLGEAGSRAHDTVRKPAKARKRMHDERKATSLPPSKLSRLTRSADKGAARLASADAEQVAALDPVAAPESSSQTGAEPMDVDSWSAVEESAEMSEGTDVPCNSVGTAQHCSSAISLQHARRKLHAVRSQSRQSIAVQVKPTPSTPA